MTQQRAGELRIDPIDLARIDEAVSFIRANDTGRILAQVMPGLTTGERAAIGAHCRLSHAAVLVFPRTLAVLHAELRARGLAAGEPTPSVVVRDRLSRRYGRSPQSLEIGILRAPVPDRDGRPCEVEIFALAVSPDGGGYNAHEDTTVLYFRGPGRPGRLDGRLELITTGHHPKVLAEHGDQSREPAHRLLQLMTGAWATQAIAVAARLQLADHLAGNGATTEQLARLTGADHDSLRRLLRYLASLGVLSASGDSFVITELGHLLRTDADHSLHPLALLYGDAFYQSFGQLMHSVRTGEESFQHVFGKNHFDYFAERPELAELFDRAMAASASLLGQVAEVVGTSAARVVVDVAGGNGELLSRILRAGTRLHGVLLERPHVLQRARATLEQAGCADRCQLIAGDFTTGVPEGGDIYLLSRVLHDWDDQQCHTILKRCADVMPRHAELLIVERLLPEDGSASLATAWDIHMMCNVGGRERTASHYRRLLAGAGFDLTTQHTLPLDLALLRATKRDPGISC